MAEIRINEYYVIKVDDEISNGIPSEGWELSIDDSYKKSITNRGKSIQEYIGLESEIVRFSNGDDLDFRSDNLVLAPIVREIPAIIEPEVVEAEIIEEDESFEEEPEVVIEDEVLEE